jgi:hypothetical protein
MKSWEMLVAGIAFCAAIWPHIKALTVWLKGLLIVTVWLDDATAAIVATKLHAEGMSASNNRLYSSFSTWVKPKRAVIPIVWEQLVGSNRVFRHGGWPIWYSRQEKSEYTRNKDRFSFLRWTVDWEQLMLDAAGNMVPGSYHFGAQALGYERHRHTITYHFGKNLGSELIDKGEGQAAKPKMSSAWTGVGTRLLGWKPDDIGSPGKSIGFSDLSLSADLECLVDEVRHWFELRSWYESHRVPWRRGYLFKGPPGTGKTSFARSVAEELDLPVHVFDLASMSNEDLRTSWGEMLKSSPCMAVIEDIDSVFHGRENVSSSGGLMSSGGLTFDCLLQCLDGVQRSHGVLLIVTTNHPEHIDEALADRPGRIDRTVAFAGLNLEGRRKLARRIVDDQETADRLALEAGDISPAKFTELCCREALSGLYKSPPLGSPYRQ